MIPKYRAWYKHEQAMFDVIGLEWSRFPEWRIIKIVVIDDHVEKNYIRYVQFSDLENYILMQCTGLLDKSKKDIYAKDIIHTRDSHGWVEWDNAKGIWIVQSFSWWCELYNAVEPEMIGNIYEHEELLRQA